MTLLVVMRGRNAVGAAFTVPVRQYSFFFNCPSPHTVTSPDLISSRNPAAIVEAGIYSALHRPFTQNGPVFFLMYSQIFCGALILHRLPRV